MQEPDRIDLLVECFHAVEQVVLRPPLSPDLIIIIIIILHSLVLVGQHGVRAQLCDRDTGERPQNPNYCQCVAHKVATKGESTHQLPCKLHPPSHTTAAHHTAIDTIPLRA